MQDYYFDRKYIKRMYFYPENICGPNGTGKTTFLSEMMQTFKHEHPIVFLNFADCNVKTYDEALLYFRKKMSDLYCRMYTRARGGFWCFNDTDHYIRIIEGKSDVSELEASLRHLIYCLRRSVKGDRNSRRPMIFIDEISRPLLLAAGLGFIREMKLFFDEFLEIDHYELTGGIFTTSYAPLNTDVAYELKYIGNKPVNKIIPLADYCSSNGLNLDRDLMARHSWSSIRYFDKCISLEECYKEWLSTIEDPCGFSCDYSIVLDEKYSNLISGKKKWVEKQRKSEQEAELRRKEQERKEYASSLPKGCIIPSKFAGMRSFSIGISSKEKYIKLNQILRSVYSLYGNEVTVKPVYSFIQNMADGEKMVEGISEALERLKEKADSKETIYSCSIDSQSTCWGRFDLQRLEKESGYSDMSLVKVYLSVSERERIAAVFEDVVGFLIDNGSHRFHAKAAFDFRSDQMCFWVSREDLFVLEKYIKKFDEILITPLLFIAYRNKLGISREFWSWDSHSGVQAALICTYLRQVKSVEKIDILDMYSKYVQAWNGEAEGTEFSSEFKKSNAQEFIILLESLDVILGNTSLKDDSILLNGDGHLWSALGNSKNWYEVGVEMSRKGE